MQSLLEALDPVTAVIGAQWGDEGKGKIVDILAERFHVIARACGGANAGHTIVVSGKQTVFHLIPSGSLHDGKEIILGSGMVIHLPTLLEEIRVLRDAGVDVVPRLHVSSAAHILFDFHKQIDSALEEERKKAKGEGIGTTKRGIGPAYMDKAERTGLRLGSVNASDNSLREYLSARAMPLKRRYDIEIDIDREIGNIREARDVIGGCVNDGIPLFLKDTLDAGKTVLIEGAQGTLLDLDHGTYPHVTSSATTVSGALQGLGLPPMVVTSCIGVAKAYCTRVGSGPFPTEAKEEDANRLRTRGGEYGATTGRPRRCGWLDIGDLRYAAMVNGISHWNITKLDVLDEEGEIPVRVSEGDSVYRYEKLPGWKTSTQGLTTFAQLPENAKRYIAFLEENTGIPVTFIGTGREREHMILRS